MTGERRAAAVTTLRNRVVDERDERGALEIYIPARAVCVTVARGHFSTPMARRWIEVVGAYFVGEIRFVTFHDWEAMTSYDSAARRALTTWLVANTRFVASADFLVSSRLVAMGVSTANLMTTLAGLPMVAHTERRPFEEALARAI